MPDERRRPRRLVNPIVDTVALVDRPANRREFAVVKRDAMGKPDEDVEEVELDKGDADVGDGDAQPLAELLGDAADVVKRVGEALADRMRDARAKAVAARKRRGGRKRENEEDMEKALTVEGLLKNDDELEAAADLFEAVEKMFGQYPYPSPLRRYPYPGAYPRANGAPAAYPLPTAFDADRLKAAVSRAMAIPGVPDAVKAALQEVVDALEEAAGKRAKAGEPVAKSVDPVTMDGLTALIEGAVEKAIKEKIVPDIDASLSAVIAKVRETLAA